MIAEGPPMARKIDYIKLEERRVLNATFAFDLMAAELTLGNFTDSGIGDDSIELNQSGNDFVFTLNDGAFSAGNSINGLNFNLTANDSTLTIIDGVNSISNVSLDPGQSNSFEVQFGQFNLGSGTITIGGVDGQFAAINETSGATSQIFASQFSFDAGEVDLSLSVHDFDTLQGTATNDIFINEVDDLSIPTLQSESGLISVVTAGNLTVGDLSGQNGIKILDPLNTGDAGDSISLISTNGSIDVLGSVDNFAGSTIALAAANDISLDGSLFSDGGDIFLTTTNGDVEQLGTATIHGNNLQLSIAGNANLDSLNELNGINANIGGDLSFTNNGDLTIAADDLIFFDGVNVAGSLELTTNGNLSQAGTLDVAGSSQFNVFGNLTDSDNANTTLAETVAFNVSGDIVLGDGSATLRFVGQDISQLLDDGVSTAFVSISAPGNGGGLNGNDVVETQNVSLYVDSSIILGDVVVANQLFIDTVENGNVEGDILQTMTTAQQPSLIQVSAAAFVANRSLQLTNSQIGVVSAETNQDVATLIQPFQINANILSTFTGSLDANILSGSNGSESFLASGVVPIDGVFDIEQEFRDDGFAAGNNEFVNQQRVGTIIINQEDLQLVSFASQNLSARQLENVSTPTNSITSLGDIYVESTAEFELNVGANVITNSAASNITIVSGSSLTLSDGVEFRRSEGSELVGLVNPLFRNSDSPDLFDLNNPRSVFETPGNAVFSDLNAQLDTSVGFQNFDLFFGNSGEQSFNLIVGYFQNDISPSNAISPEFQLSLANNLSDVTSDFQFADSENFGQGVSAFLFDLPSAVAGTQEPLELTNITQFDQGFFAQESFLLSQQFVTNDARINLFSEAGTNDLNFSQEVLPTRTVVENPAPIVVPLPTFVIPEAVADSSGSTFVLANLVQEGSDQPLLTAETPQSYFQIKYTADDDGIFEEEFKWQDQNDDPDTIRAIIEEATLVDQQEYWPDTSEGENANWTELIKDGNVKPGLYFIFEVQEGDLVPDPVDTPVDRTDLENLVEPDASETTNSTQTIFNSAELSKAIVVIADLEPDKLDEFTALDSRHETPVGTEQLQQHRFGKATQQAMLGSSLLICQLSMRGQQLQNQTASLPASSGTNNLFSRTARLVRKANRTFRTKAVDATGAVPK